MKKFLLFIVIALLACACECLSQNSGLGFHYNAVVRKADGALLANSDVSLRISLYPGQQAQTPTWVEAHKVHTDASGCFGITVGKGSRQNGVAARFSDINFAAVYYWMRVEIQDGNYYREVSYAQLPSSPYSEVAYNAMLFPGMIVPFAGPESKIPEGWLLCDGRAVSRNDYAALYQAIGICWGKGNGTTTFNIPDLRGMFLRGVAGNSDKDPDKNSRTALKSGGNSGNAVGSFQEDAIRNITGKITRGNGSDDGPLPGGGTGSGALEVLEKTGNGAAGTNNVGARAFGFDASKDPNVKVGADNRPVNVYVNYIIKY